MRAIIRLILSDTSDEKVIELKKKIEELVKDEPRATVDISMITT